MKVSQQAITLTQLAQLLGVSYSAIRKAMLDKRLCTSITRLDNGRYQVDAKQAIKEWQENTNFNVSEHALESHSNDSCVDSELIPSYQTSRKEQKYYQAKSAKLKYKTDAGSLIKKDDVERMMSHFMTRVKTEFMAIPSQLSALLAAEENEFNIHHMLDSRIKTILTNIAKENTNGL